VSWKVNCWFRGVEVFGQKSTGVVSFVVHVTWLATSRTIPSVLLVKYREVRLYTKFWLASVLLQLTTTAGCVLLVVEEVETDKHRPVSAEAAGDCANEEEEEEEEKEGVGA